MKIFDEKSQLMTFMKTLEHLLHLQFLCLAYTIRGVFIVGLFPSISTLYAATRMVIRTEGTGDINEFYKENYKKTFKESNLIGYTMSLFIILLVANLRSAQLIQSKIGFIYVFISYGLIIFMLVFSVSIWAFLSHFNLSIFQTLRHALIILLLNPLHVLSIFIVLVLFAWSAIRFGVLLPLILVSLMVFCITYIVKHAINRTKIMQYEKIQGR